MILESLESSPRVDLEDPNLTPLSLPWLPQESSRLCLMAGGLPKISLKGPECPPLTLSKARPVPSSQGSLPFLSIVLLLRSKARQPTPGYHSPPLHRTGQRILHCKYIQICHWLPGRCPHSSKGWIHKVGQDSDTWRRQKLRKPVLPPTAASHSPSCSPGDRN